MTGVLLCLLAVAAPVPVARTKPESRPPVGVWMSATWNGQPWNVLLTPDGRYHGYHQGTAYDGGWTWNQVTRTFLITERPLRLGHEPRPYSEFMVVLNTDLAGRTKCGAPINLKGRR